MNGFTDTQNGFNFQDLQLLQSEAEKLYVGTTGDVFELPTVAYDVTDQTAMDAFGLTALVADGATDDSAALNLIGANTGVTNWYIPTGKTVVLYGVEPPAHIEAIYGDASIINKWEDTGYPAAAFTIRRNPTTHLLIDGLGFTAESNSGGNGDYGMLRISSGENAISNIEIRNCTFTGDNVNPKNGITMYGYQETGGTKGIYIHDIVMDNLGRFGIEMQSRSSEFTNDDGAFENVSIYNSTFMNIGQQYGISFARPRLVNYIYNNTFTNNSSDIELDDCANIVVRNNLCTGASGNFMSIGRSVSGQTDYTPESCRCQIYSNHFESDSSTIHIHSGANPNFYENFVQGQIWHQTGIGGDTHNNTIVIPTTFNQSGSGDSAVQTADYESSTTYNDVYSYLTEFALYPNTSAPVEQEMSYNNVYKVNDDRCWRTSTAATMVDNVCNANYTGTVPISREGAGLLP